MYSHSGIFSFYSDFLIDQREFLFPVKEGEEKCTLDLLNRFIIQTNFSSRRCSAEISFFAAGLVSKIFTT